jgi:NADH:ubiquinone oxidoreductase subunit E
MLEIRICMGSSCFSRGNGENLRAIREYLAASGQDARVVTAGHLCEDQCSLGPNLIVDGVMHHGVHPEEARALVREHLECGSRQ